MNVYGRPVEERMAKAVEAVGDMIIPPDEDEDENRHRFSLALMA